MELWLNMDLEHDYNHKHLSSVYKGPFEDVWGNTFVLLYLKWYEMNIKTFKSQKVYETQRTSTWSHYWD